MADNQNPNNPNDPRYGGEMPGGFQTSNMQQAPEKQDFDLESMPSVAAAPGRVLLFILGLASVIGLLLYMVFSDGDEKKSVDESIAKERTVSVARRDAIPPAPVTPPPPPPSIPTPPPSVPTPPPPPPPAPIAPAPTAKVDNKSQMERMRSAMLVGNTSGKVSSPAPADGKVKGYPGSDPNLVYTREYLGDTKAEQAEATLMGDMNYLVAQGKVIDAILETAINTDLPGPLRAIVSRDVYAESGREIMIPKGSRLIGSYNSDVKRGQKRVYVIWARIIRPDGIDIAVDSPGVDQLGRAGVAGYVDNKYFEIFASAFLTSSVSIALGIGSDSLLDDSGTSSTTTSDGTTSSSGSAGSQAVLQGVRDFSDTTKTVLEGIMTQQPTITVDQGTRIKVFVNRDLIMPSSIIEQLRFIQ